MHSPPKHSGYVLALAALVCLTLETSPAPANPGVLEISQTCATQTGCFAGDTPGWPVTISAPGSYRLTSNLTMSRQVGSAQEAPLIQIDVGDVSIDMAGFRMSCSTFLGACAGGASSQANGVNAYSSTPGISIRNGSIWGMAKWCLFLGEGAIVENVRLRQCRTGGVNTSQGSKISGVIAEGNGSDGIYVGGASVVTGSTSRDNGWDGIVAGSGSTVTGNTTYENGMNGIRTGGGTTIQGNASRGNGHYGLDLSSDVAYRANTITNNTLGGVLGGANRGDNYCSGNNVSSAYCP